MIPSDPADLRRRLLDWYDLHRRELPWRANHAEPYQIWLSETMLQQTQVETVRPYYQRWLERFPTLHSLAAAEIDEVLRAWEGLGYYSRARNLHRAVREVAERYSGRVPDDPDAFRALPGVGRYTAGAVMSIAFGREEPVVDGNVRRVFARLGDEAAPADAELWRRAQALVRGERPGDLNQALMELGATLCTPRAPRCGDCPVAADCAALAAGTVLERPERKPRGPLPHEQRLAAIIEDGDGRVLIGRRAPRGRLGGLWEFPGDLLPAAGSGGAERVVEEALGITVEAPAPIAVVDHVFTHVRVSYHAVRFRYRSGSLASSAYTAAAWADAEELSAYALPRAQRRIAALALPAASSIAHSSPLPSW